MFLNGNFNSSEWYIDSGASVHLTPREDWIKNASYEQGREIIVANNEKVQALCSGDVRIITNTNERDYEICVENVLCVPSLTTNLLSVSQLIKKGNSVKFTNNGCYIYNQKHDLIATASLVNGVYKVNIAKQESLAATVVSGETWHRRLGHINKDYLNQMKNAVNGMALSENVDISKSSCEVCCEGKQCRLPFKSNGHRSSGLLEIVHTDVCGPMENISIGGAKYFLLFVDDHSRMAFIYFMKQKNETLRYFKEFKARVKIRQKGLSKL